MSPAVDLDTYIERVRAEPSKSGFVLDFDGTLSRIVPDPQGVAPIEGSVEVLEQLARTFRVVAMVSGRRAENLASIVGASGIRYLGVYGAEELVEERLAQPQEADRWRGMASRLARDAEVLITTEGLQGAQVEYKDLAVSIHFRRAADPAGAGEIIRRWAETAAPKRGFDPAVGRMVVELRPVGVTKGSALERIVDEAGLSFVVSAGDDSADVEALQAARSLLGSDALTIGVLSDESPAGLREASTLLAKSPTEVLEILRRFV